MSPLKAARIKRGMTQKQLADQVGIQQPSLSDLEKGRTTASAATAKKLAAILEISELEILYPERFGEVSALASVGNR